jgi:hypothetical protein
LRGLSDEQLARTANMPGASMSADQAAERILIGHPEGHLQSIPGALRRVGHTALVRSSV